MRSVAVKVAGFLALGAAATASGAELRGRVLFAEEAPPAKVRKVSKDSFVCGDQQPDESLVVSKDGGLANVVVSLADAPGDDGPDPPAPVLDKEDCRFVPHVVVAQVGQKLEMINSDDTFHSAHGRTGEETRFNSAFPERDKRRTVTLHEAGVVEVGCDAGHDWMRAYVHVFDHPYFTVTKKDGRFALDVPPGHYTLRIWHETMGTRRVPVDVGLGGGRVEINFP